MSFLGVWNKQGWTYMLASVFKSLKIINTKDQQVPTEVPSNSPSKRSPEVPSVFSVTSRAHCR